MKAEPAFNRTSAGGPSTSRRGPVNLFRWSASGAPMV